MAERIGGSAYRRGRDALPRDPALHVLIPWESIFDLSLWLGRPSGLAWKLPFADYAAATLYPTFTPFACSRFLNVQRRSRGSATLPRHARRPPNADAERRTILSPGLNEKYLRRDR